MNCSVCDIKLEGFWGGKQAERADIEEARQEGADVQDNICTGCLYNAKVEAKSNKLKKAENASQLATPPVDIYTINPFTKNEFTYVGFVSAHTALGTGPVSQIVSALTDFVGRESETYSTKMREAESICLKRLAWEAHNKGANAIVGVQPTYTELTGGHGMLLICMAGTAIYLTHKETTVKKSEYQSEDKENPTSP